MNWAQKGYPAEKFPDGVEQWMIQNNGSTYFYFERARKHFLFWVVPRLLFNKMNSICIRVFQMLILGVVSISNFFD